MPDKKVTPFGGIQSSILLSSAFSPDGKWVAYEAKDASSAAIPLFVQPFPPTGATYQVTRIGVHATWSPDGKELFYGPAGGQVLGVTVTTRPAFSFGNPEPIAVRFLDSGPLIERNNDITRDGRRFLGVIAGKRLAGAGDPGRLNWAELKHAWRRGDRPAATALDDGDVGLSAVLAHGLQAMAPRARSCTSVVVSLVPDAPSGWPSEIAPPLTFSRAGSAGFLQPGQRQQANASFTSNRSMSSMVMPAFFSAWRVVGSGASASPDRRRRRSCGNARQR
jgi:hypothetical protein